MTRSSSRIQTILSSLHALPEPVRVHGSLGASRALLFARWAIESQSSLLIICPTDDSASDLVSDLQTVSSLILQNEFSVLHFPTWDQSPYSSVAPSLKTRFQRISVLSQLKQADFLPEPGARILVTTLAGLCQATLPPAVFDQHRIQIEVEGSVESREDLMRRLLGAGYLRVDPVEDPGTFAVRGDIIDVFPPDRTTPLRIELFGDVVERIREFDPTSQRAQPSVEGQAILTRVVLPPAREALINPETLPLVRERLKSHADDQGVSRGVRDPILGSMQDGIYPDHSDTWAPFSYAEPATLWDYCSGAAPGGAFGGAFSEAFKVAYNDELSCQQEWDRFQDDQKSRAKDAATSGAIVPPFEDLFRLTPRFEKSLRERTRLYVDQLELTDAETLRTAADLPDDFETGAAGKGPDVPNDAIAPKHRVFVRTNMDLMSGSRHSLGDLEAKFQLWLKQGFQILALAQTQSQLERIRFLLEERNIVCQVCRIGDPLQPGLISLGIGSATEGFRWPAEGLVLITESEILGTRHVKSQRRAKKQSTSAAKDWAGLQALSDLQVGDAVVHVDHGIGRYQGLVRLSLSGAPADFLLLEYASKDKLYLPVYRLNVIQKYSGAGDTVALDKLGSLQFAKAKDKVRDAVKKLAFDLVQLYAQRKVKPGIRFSPRDADFREFEAKFPFDETPDQIRAIDDALSDMESGKVMDRLVCGDVGYGKTEVAIRAAFKAVSDGKQVVLLVPTTVLAHQHEQSFRARMKDYPINVESVSRFKPAREQKRILEQVATGKVDIIVGTHRLLSQDVKFKDLGLVIVDEEHRFGVEHKERLKTLKINTHVLTLTATPIPRTLHMSLSGLRDISLINTPPVDRLPIRTYVSKFDENVIKQAVEVELNRGGQVFFVHNRVQSIYEMANKIRALVPHAQITVGHGQMGEGELEKVMMEFYQKKANVLVSTTIIESGIDVPTANTMIVNRADSFGLAQLYQIRGRVGRGQNRAYAYLLLPPEGMITEDAKRRLEVIQRFVELGSGFSIASHDLEIRGGGNLLGPQQSGHIAAVGFDLYTELLEEAIREIEGRPITPEESTREPEIKAPFPAFLGEDYIPDVHQRLSLYRRLSGASTDSDLDRLEEELRDRFGPLPAEAQNLLWLVRIKQLLKRMGIEILTVGSEKVSMVSGPGGRLDPVRTIALVSSDSKRYQLTPDSKFVAKVPTGSLRDLYFALETLFKDLMPRAS